VTGRASEDVGPSVCPLVGSSSRASIDANTSFFEVKLDSGIATRGYMGSERGCLQAPRAFKGSTRGTHHGRGWALEIREDTGGVKRTLWSADRAALSLSSDAVLIVCFESLLLKLDYKRISNDPVDRENTE
jgi:hypothetical protein